MAPNGNDEPLVSFIIPLHNKESYILKTLHSINACEYKKKEVIIIDDCSTDKSLELAKNFSKKKPNFKIIKRTKNGGLSIARNTGLKYATGKYIQFWDADDIYSHDGLSKVISIMEKNNSEIATGIATRNKKIPAHYKLSQRLVSQTTLQETPTALSASSVCFKVYRTSFLTKNHLKFEEKLYMQDYEFNFRAFTIAKKISLTPYILGEYVFAKNSNFQLINEEKLLSPLKIYKLTTEHLKKHGLLELEPLQQYQIILKTLIFFIQRCLSCREVNEWHSFIPFSEKYLKIYSDFIQNCPAGIKILIKKRPRIAMACVALSSNKFSIAKIFLLNKTPSFSIFKVANALKKNPFNLGRKKLIFFLIMIKISRVIKQLQNGMKR